MSNPTNKAFPSDIAQIRTTDYRPSKQLYINVNDNNAYRQYLQRNSDKIRKQQLQRFEDGMGACKCEENNFQIVDFNFPTLEKRLQKCKK